MAGSITKIEGDIALLKARLQSLRDGSAWDLGFSFPIRKVDEERWEVEGVAQAEIVDAQNEIITYEASKKAFSAFAGNVREQHDPMKAVGRAVSVVCDDAARQVVVRAMISRGAPDTWFKVRDGVLRGFSIGGTRLRSSVEKSGVRRTTEYRLNELSLVDVPANPRAFFSLAKVTHGVPLATELLASGEEKMECARASAVAVERVASVLAAGCRPLPQEVGEALREVARVAGTPAVGCDSTSLRDFAVDGPVWARQLRDLAGGLKASHGDADRTAIAKAAEVVLLEFVHTGRRPTGEIVSASKLYDSAAEALSKLQAAPSSRRTEGYDSLAASIFKLADMRRAEGAEVRGPVTLDELREMEERLTKSLSEWNENGLPQNGKEYELLSRTYIKVAGMRKRAEGLAVRLGRM